MCHFPDSMVPSFFSTHFIVIFQFKVIQITDIDYDIRMDVAVVKTACTYVLSSTTKRDRLQITPG